MAFGFVILAVLILFALAFLGMGIWAVPVGIVGVLALVFLFGNRAKRVSDAGGDKGIPHDTPGGPTHVREDYAHEGQANMTPEQSQRAGA